jgi:hypothetical protein
VNGEGLRLLDFFGRGVSFYVQQARRPGGWFCVVF